MVGARAPRVRPPPDVSTSIGRTALATVILLGLTSAPSMSLWRWVVGSYNDVHSWPYRTTMWAPLAAGTALLWWDVVQPDRHRQHGPVWSRRIGLTTAGLALWILTSIVWSTDPGHTAVHAALAVLLLSSAAWFGVALSPIGQVGALFMATQVATLGSLAAVALTPSARFSPYVGDRSWIGLFGNPNTLGAVAALAVVPALALWHAVGRPPRWRGALGLVVVADVVVAVAATSYTAWLGLLGALSAWVLTPFVSRLLRGGSAAARWRVAGGTAMALAVSLILVRPVVGWFGKDPTFSGRTAAWSYAAGAAWERPQLGFGFGAFWHDPVRQFDYMARTGRDWIASSHSTLVDSYVDLGVPGALLVVALAATCVGLAAGRACMRPSWDNRFWAAIAVFALVENLAESMMLMHSIFWFLLVASGFAGAARDDAGKFTVLRRPGRLPPRPLITGPATSLPHPAEAPGQRMDVPI